jgi:pyruvate,water dikinase
VVRSSAVGEGAGFSGLLTTFLGVRGPEALLTAIQACWLSRWSDNVVRYALGRGLDLRQLRVGVLVQRMVLAEAAGGARSQAGQVTVEATWGLGRGLAEGEVVPDVWRVEHGVVHEVRRGDKRLRVDLDARGGESWRRVPDDEASRPCLEEAAILELARVVHRTELVFGEPVEVEWAVAEQWQPWLLQVRSLQTATSGPGSHSESADGRLDGLPASPGQAVGRARVIGGVAEVGRLGPHDVLVAERLAPGALAGAPLLAGLVLEAGGTTSHAATLARERGIPAVFGVRDATRLISTGADLLVDVDTGRVVRLASK